MQQPHSYSAAPQAAPIRKNKTKYRDEGGDENIDLGNTICFTIYYFYNYYLTYVGINQMQNLMHDPRVVRGSTYAAKLENTNNVKGIDINQHVK